MSAKAANGGKKKGKPPARQSAPRAPTTSRSLPVKSSVKRKSVGAKGDSSDDQVVSYDPSRRSKLKKQKRATG